MNSGLTGKKALITGGGSGIGRAIALALAEEGVHLAVASRNPEKNTIEKIKALGVKVLRLCVDVSNEKQVIKMVKQAIDGLDGLDFYVNNAAGTWHQSVTEITTENWTKTINANLSACIWACREVAKHMIIEKQGSILIVGSTVMYFPCYREGSYKISKTGLKVFMETLAIELAPFGIRVNMLTPGHYPTRLTENLSEEKAKILTAQIPLRRFGKPEEIGASSVLLLSDKLSPYTTGAELVIDGGLKLRPLPMWSDNEIRQMNL